MRVLPTTVTWLFDGVGGAAVIFLIGLLIQRYRSKERSSDATLTAQGAKVENSPVASGSGITQTVNSPTTVNLNVGKAFEAALPQLNIEIREVCFDDVLESVTEDLADFTVERNIFVRVWIVNKESVATAVKKWSLAYSKDGKTVTASEVTDFSKWHQHVKWKERQSSMTPVMYVIKEARNTLTPFPAQPLLQGIPSEGWVCFKAPGVNGMGNEDGRIELNIVDSFNQKYCGESPAPLACKGTMTNTDLPW
jgi:hypothetical protein